MGLLLLVLVGVLVVAGLLYGVFALLSGEDPGLGPVDPDGRARPLPNNRSLTEFDLKTVRFDVGLRGYRMSQVDKVLRRTAYDIGYKDEMIAVLEAEVIALREGRSEDAELLRKARESAASTAVTTPPAPASSASTPDSPPASAPIDVLSSGGTHRADVELEPDVNANYSDDFATDDDDETFAATAPGRLNRSALRTADDPELEAVPDATLAGSEVAPDPSAEREPEPEPAEPSPEPSADPSPNPTADPTPAAADEEADEEPDEEADVAAERGARG